MPTIDIRIKDKIAMKTGGEAFIVRDNSDYVINFTFDVEWAEETAKTARFALQGGGYMDVPFTGSSVAVPVISTGRRVDVGVFAGNLRTTTSATLPLVPSIRSKGGAPVPPEDAVYDKLIALINSMGEISDDDIKQAVEDYLSANPIAAASMRVDSGYIQYSNDNGKTWVNLISEADLKGDKGDKGDPGTPGKDGTSITISGISESAADGGTNTVTFSDGSALRVKNGSKGSAGADGTDGITPHIGENGNWYIGSTDTGNPSRGATGPQGPAGAPGKDGADMGITGATVGQIAKITAVDASGVPTAWEPVDMPEQVQPDWNQNDDTQPDYVKNRPFYSETRNVTVENVTDAALEGFPVFVTGDTVTVNVDGMEYSLVAYYDESEGVFTIGDIYSDLENGGGQLGWQIWCDNESAHFYATEAHTVSYLGVFIYKIDNKFINTDGFARTFDYHFKEYSLYKTLYNSAGDSCTLYTCSDFIVPNIDSNLFGFMDELGFSIVDSASRYSCLITGCIINITHPGIRIVRVILGTDTSYMETMAADNGYTYTTNPNA